MAVPCIDKGGYNDSSSQLGTADGRGCFVVHLMVLPHSTTITSTTSINSLFMSLDPTIMGSNLSNSQIIIDVVDVIEVECGTTLKIINEFTLILK